MTTRAEKNDLANQSAEHSIQANDYHVHPDRTGKFVYWGLGLALLAFLAVTGYRIYQHELNQTNITANVQQDSQSVDNQQDPQLLLTSEPNDTIENDSLLPSLTTAEEKQDGKDEETQSISKESDDDRREFYENLAQEEEVKRRVEEELQALEEQIQAEELVKQQAEEAQVAELLQNAMAAREKFSLLKPEGESAYDYYSRVLELDSENEFAITGLDDIADAYFSLALRALEKNDPDKASGHLTDLIKVRPNDPRLDGFLQQITDLKAELILAEEKKRLLEELAEVEKKKAQTPNIQPQPDPVPSIASPSPENENNESTTSVATIKTDEENKESTEQTEDQKQDQPEQVDQVKQQPPAINRVQLAAMYNTYDSGRYSNKLFNNLLDAANKNEGRAQYIVAEMYAAGRGIEQNFAESTFWLKRSLDYVNQNAKYRQPWAEKAMGVIYEKGWYVDSDTSRAVRWYKSSAEKGYSPAQYRLGLAYAKGLGVSKDTEQAEFWLKKALSNGHQEAKKALSKIPSRN